MPNKIPLQLPYLSSERHFRLYEPYIAEIVTRWPQAVPFVPKPPVASTETLASRIRICINALRANIQSNDGTWQTSFPIGKFLQIADEITVSVTALPGQVLCGPYDQVRKRTPMGVAVSQPDELTQVVPKVHLFNPELDLLTAILVLHHHKLLTEPSIIESNADVALLAERYDVAVEKNGTTYTII